LRRVARHPVGQNAASLLGVQFATFVLPLLTLPYLSRVLEGHAFGLVLIAQGLALVLGLLVDFGFEYTGARDVAQSRGDDRRVAELAARILGARVALIGFATVAAAGALLAIGDLREEPALVAFAWLTAVAQGLYPGWFFVGRERLRLISLIQFVARLAGVAGVFVLVSSPGDAWIAVACNAAATVTVCVVGTTLMYRRVRLRAPQVRRAWTTLRESAAVFAGTGAIAVYSSANVIVLGFFVPSGQVAQFGAAERVVRALVQLMGPVAMAVFPRMARLQADGATDRARTLARIAVGVLAGGALVGAALLALLADRLIPFVFGDGYEEGIGLLRILVLILPLIGVTSVLAGGWMMAMRMDGAIVRSALRAGATSLTLSLTLTPLLGPEGLAMSVVAAEVVALASCLWEIRRHGARSRPSATRRRHVFRRRATASRHGSGPRATAARHGARPRTIRRPDGGRSGRIRGRMVRALLGGVAAVAVAAVLALVLLGGDDPSGPVAQPTGAGPLDYDRSVPLRVREDVWRDLGSKAPSIRARGISYDGADGRRVPAMLGVPKVGSAPFPCVVFQGGIGMSKEEAITYGDAFAQLGMATFTIDNRNAGITRSRRPGTNRRMVRDPQRIADSLQRTTIDLRRGLDLLQTRSECLPDRFGAIGISQGGLYAALLAGADERVRATILVVTGGDWRTILSGGDDFLLPGIQDSPKRLEEAIRLLDPFDPVHWVRRIPPRALMLVNGRFDPLTSIAAADELRDAAGPTASSIRYDGGHDPFDPDVTAPETMRKVLAKMTAFLEKRLIAED